MKKTNRMFGTAKIYKHFSFRKREKHLVLLLFFCMVSVPALAQLDVQLPPAEAIDLGLPSGTRWASCNVGATKPEEFGGKYAWGETEEKLEYTEENYQFSGQNIGSNISGTEYDVAHVKWGGNWQMPTRKQLEELINKCSHEVAKMNGANGVKLTGPNGSSIFFPFNDDWWGDFGTYWTGTPNNIEGSSYNLFIRDNGSVSCFESNRYIGRSVRPVETSFSIPPSITITPEEGMVNFGAVKKGTNKTETFMVTNTGNSNLTFHVDGSTEFTSRIEVSDNMTTYMLAPGDSKVYNVIAHGLSAGYEASTLIFVKSDNSDEETKVKVTCVGDDDEPLIDNTSFTMAIGEKASIRVKTPYYSIEEDLEGIVDCIGGGPGATEYWDKDHDSYVKHFQIGLTFTALKAGVVHITFKNKYSGQTEVLTITVTDDSAVPTISITPSEIDFGVVEYGKDKTETFTVTNTGNASLTFHVPQAAESNKYFDISDAEEEYTLAPGNSKEYTITCHGLKKGHKAWVDFRILSNAENGEQAIRVNSVGWDSTPLIATKSLTMNVGDKKNIEMHGSNMGAIEIINNNPDIVSVIKGSDTGGGGSIGFDGEYSYGYTSLYINALAQGTATVKVVDTGVNEEAILTITVTDKSQEPIGMEPRMIVWHKDGTKVYFALSDSPKITYEGEKVFIKGSSMVELDYQSIKKITYETEEDIIDNVKDLVLSKKKPFKNNDETITFLPAEEDLHVRVVSLNGMVIKDFVVRKGEISTVSLNSFSRNVYLIVVNGVTYKIAIR